jgi:hypothetical protein
MTVGKQVAVNTVSWTSSGNKAIFTKKYGSRIVNGSVTVARNHSRLEWNTTVVFIKGSSSSTKILANLAIPPNASMATVEPFHDNRKPARVEVLLVVGEVKLGSNVQCSHGGFLSKAA